MEGDNSFVYSSVFCASFVMGNSKMNVARMIDGEIVQVCIYIVSYSPALLR